MSDFDVWQAWAPSLSDVDFANAWATLGVYAAAGTAQWAVAGDAARVTIPPHTILRAVLKPETDWRFPHPGQFSDTALEIPPLEWANAWRDVIRYQSVSPRLRVVSAPPGEPVLEWFRLLGETDPKPASVWIDIQPPGAMLFVEWPLRLAALPGNEAVDVIERTHRAGPLDRLTRPMIVSREADNSDLLVHVGTPKSLLTAILTLPVRPKADLIVIAGSLEPDPGEALAVRDELLHVTHGSGLVVIPEGENMVPGLVESLFKLAHNQPFDCAIFEGIASRARLTPAMWLSRDLANTRLEDVARRLFARASRARPRMAPPPDLESITFEHEVDGATEVAEFTTAAAAEEPDAGAVVVQARRFLQQQSFVQHEMGGEPATGGFVVGRAAIVRVRIGPPNEQWNALPHAFPAEELPKDFEEWKLTVWLTEPLHLERPLRTTIVLPQNGASTEGEFEFTPVAAGAFEGRITVIHRGRVLQTALLTGAVRDATSPPADDATPRLGTVLPVRRRLGELGERRQFDLAFVLNRSTDGQPRAVALSDEHAWISDTTRSLAVADDINIALSRVAKSVPDYQDGLGGENGRALLVTLAQQGHWLKIFLVDEQLKARGNRPHVAAEEYIQIISTKTDAVVPFEFIYEHAVPDGDAALCDNWRQAVVDGKCGAQCDKDSGRIVCPMGFWGLTRVIERHIVTPEHAAGGRELFLQSEPGRATDGLKIGGTALVASSSRVTAPEVAALVAEMEKHLGARPATAATWTEWAKTVEAVHPRLLVALPHTDGRGVNVSLEIGGETIKTVLVRDKHVAIPPDGPPLVALLGCDTAGTAEDYGSHVAVFRNRGAAIVIATIATVFGDHAARVAQELVNDLVPADGAAPARVGEAIRALRRRSLLGNLLMPLCLVAYGDADWHLTK